MEIDNTRVEKLRSYLFNILSDLEYNYHIKSQIGIDFLNDKVANYSLDKIPVASTVETWITGDKIYRDVFSFRSRMNYSADVMNNLQNIGFFELFEKIIDTYNRDEILPNIEGIESIECLNCGTLNNATTSTAEFDIQIQITYRYIEKEEPI